MSLKIPLLTATVLLNISPWGWMIMDSFTMANAKPSNMSHNIQNTDVRQTETMLLSICGPSVSFPRNKALGAKMLLDLWPRPHCSLAVACVTDLLGPPTVERCVQSWTERESFLRSEGYNALAGSHIKLVCFSSKEVEVFGF